MKRVMYIVELATYGDGKDIMDHEAVYKSIRTALNQDNVTARIACIEYGSVRLIGGDGADVTDVFGCMNRKKYELVPRPKDNDAKDELDKCKEELDRYRRAFEKIDAIGPSASMDEYITAVCRAEAIINGGEVSERN